MLDFSSHYLLFKLQYINVIGILTLAAEYGEKFIYFIILFKALELLEVWNCGSLPADARNMTAFAWLANLHLVAELIDVIAVTLTLISPLWPLTSFVCCSEHLYSQTAVAKIGHTHMHTHMCI